MKFITTSLLKIQHKDLFNERSYHINLSILEPWPVHYRYIAWRWILASVYFGFSTIVFAAHLFGNHTSQNGASVTAFLIILFLVTLVSIIFSIYLSPNVTEFRSRYGNCPVIRLMQNKPDKKAFSQFVAEIRTRILAACHDASFDKKQMLAFELQEIRRLKDQGTVTDTQYSHAKERVLKINM